MGNDKAWEPTGFPDQRTATPKSIDGRQTLLRALQNYFANHPEHENPALNVTAEQAGILYETLVSARAEVAESLTLTALAKQKRDSAIRDLRRRMRGSIDELELLMPDDDARWYVFGLNPPVAPDSPEKVEEVELVATGPGNVLSSWGGAPRADRYRVFKQIVGVDAAPVHVATVYDTQFLLPGLSPGETVRVQVTAANDAGETELSEAVEIMVT